MDPVSCCSLTEAGDQRHVIARIDICLVAILGEMICAVCRLPVSRFEGSELASVPAAEKKKVEEMVSFEWNSCCPVMTEEVSFVESGRLSVHVWGIPIHRLTVPYLACGFAVHMWLGPSCANGSAGRWQGWVSVEVAVWRCRDVTPTTTWRATIICKI